PRRGPGHAQAGREALVPVVVPLLAQVVGEGGRGAGLGAGFEQIARPRDAVSGRHAAIRNEVLVVVVHRHAFVLPAQPVVNGQVRAQTKAVGTEDTEVRLVIAVHSWRAGYKLAGRRIEGHVG